MSFDYEAQINHDLLPEETVTEIAGKRISAFCSDYKTYKMELTTLKTQTRGNIIFCFSLTYVTILK